MCQGTGRIRSARGHMVFAKPCEACGGQRPAARRQAAGRAAATASRRAMESVPVPVPAGNRGRRAVAGLGRRACRPSRRPARRSVRRRACRAASVVPARGRRPAPRGAGGDARGGAGREDRHPDARRAGEAARAAGHAVGAAAAAARARRTGAAAGRRGDLIVEVRLVLPPMLDERSKELLREFGRINGEDVRRGLWAAENDGSGL